MPVDTSIYSNVRPFTMGDPFETAGKVLALKDAQRKYSIEDDIEKAGAVSGGDPNKMAEELLRMGHYGLAFKLNKETNLSHNAELDHKLKMYEAAGSDAMTMDQVYRQALQRTGDKAAAVAAIQPMYSQVRQKWSGMGFDLPESFDPDVNFSRIGQAKEAIQYIKTLAPEIKMTDTGGSIVPMNVNPNAGPVGPLAGAQPIQKTPSPAGPTELARYQAERDQIARENPSDPRLLQYDRTIENFKAGRGTNITVLPPGPMTPGRTGANKVDEDMLGVTRNLMQLDAISNQFKPEFQRFQDKAGYAALSIKDSTYGLNNKEKKDLGDYSQYRRNAFNTLNEYIKSITGAAMTDSEAKRILKGLPNPGAGLFDGDSPTEFKAKLDDAVQKTKMSVARLSYIKRHGLSLEDGSGNAIIPLEQMPSLINERGSEIEKELQAAQPGVKKEALQKAVRRQLSIEFGLSAD